eukprot:TRINITY_DN15141_c0_g1_i1.p1 TRINITY_DN15141_c0_g1~~TRINITY_DN15141_c0_g1_i1.p1  ORF type:complete len:373 (-),score=93.26 TRINITY_DN15141_c0_g1_i1:21-1139(-)
MRILKPNFVNHSGSPIFSIDIHPDGTRFVTSGSDNLIKIWDYTSFDQDKDNKNQNKMEESVLDNEGELKEISMEETDKRLLATLNDHTKTVMCVRWSKDGQFLASGGDDKLIFIWKLMGGGNEMGSLNENPNTENWRVFKVLTGHKGDISDISWSYDNRMIASSSLDGTIMIWDTSVSSFGKLIRELNGHNGLIKGISWDPRHQFLASQSEDKSVIFWRISDWKIEGTLKHPFQGTAGTSFFHRLSWSPDGEQIVATNGLNSKHHIAPVINRGSWDVKCDYVGHLSPIVVAKFNPRLFKKKSNTKKGYGTLAVLGGSDCDITGWTSFSPRPLFILKKPFKNSVLDISWNSEGDSFMASSYDGSVLFVQLSAK